MSLLPDSVTRTWSSGGYYFPEGDPFPDNIWDWVTDIGTGAIFDILGPTLPPDAISEVAQTWEALERLEPELFEPILETRPGRVADSYPQDVSDDIEPEDDVATTWSDWFADTAQGLIGDFIQPQPAAPMGMNAPLVMGPSTPANQAATVAAMATGDCDGMTWAGGAPPKGYKVVRDSCGNGVLRKVRRRRRRRMLSASDKSDIAAIVSMVGKGQMASALINRSTN